MLLAEKSALIREVRYEAVEQETISSPQRIFAAADGKTVIQVVVVIDAKLTPAPLMALNHGLVSGAVLPGLARRPGPVSYACARLSTAY